MDKRKREIECMISSVGLKLEVLKINGNSHYGGEVVASDGRSRKFTFSSTPGERRGDHNKKAMLKRFASGKDGRLG